MLKSKAWLWELSYAGRTELGRHSQDPKLSVRGHQTSIWAAYTALTYMTHICREPRKIAQWIRISHPSMTLGELP